MEILRGVLLGSLVLAAVLFFISIYNNILGKIKWTKFMSLALLSLAFSCAVTLSYADGYMPRFQVDNLIIAGFVFIGLSGLFYLTYKLTKRDNT